MSMKCRLLHSPFPVGLADPAPCAFWHDFCWFLVGMGKRATGWQEPPGNVALNAESSLKLVKDCFILTIKAYSTGQSFIKMWAGRHRRWDTKIQWISEYSSSFPLSKAVLEDFLHKWLHGCLSVPNWFKTFMATSTQSGMIWLLAVPQNQNDHER